MGHYFAQRKINLATIVKNIVFILSDMGKGSGQIILAFVSVILQVSGRTPKYELNAEQFQVWVQSFKPKVILYLCQILRHFVKSLISIMTEGRESSKLPGTLLRQVRKCMRFFSDEPDQR